MLAVLAASHAVNDWLAGWLLGGEMPDATAWDRLPWLVIYAALAFAGQLPAAWIIERAPRPDRWLAGALGLLVVTVAAAGAAPGLAVIFSGVASAVIHVAGGALALQLPRGERALGWFSAPGVIGLLLGGWLGQRYGGVMLWAVFLPVALLAGWAALRAYWPVTASPEPARDHAPGAIDAHDGLMLLILLALTLRSALWDLVQVAQLGDPHTLLAIALAAAAGKVFGGWMISRWPSIRPVCLTLLTACVLLEWGRGSLVMLCTGIALLQSTIPASIVLLHRSFGTTPARATAYGLGLTVALGGLVFPMQFTLPATLLGLAAVALAVLWRAAHRERRWLAETG
jgi:MFS family permease